MNSLRTYLPTVKKVIGGLIACIPLLIAQGVLPSVAATWVTVLTPLLVAMGVYFAPANVYHPRKSKSEGVN